MDSIPNSTKKRRKGGAEQERKTKRQALDQHAAKYQKVDEMFKAHSMKSKKHVATTSALPAGGDDSGIEPTLPSDSSEEPTGGDNTRAGASAAGSASSEELAAALPAGGDDSGIEVQAEPTLPSDSSEEPTAALPAGGDDSGIEPTLPSDSSEEPTGGTPLTKMDTEEIKSQKNDQYYKEPHDDTSSHIPHSFCYTIRSHTGEEVTVSCGRSQILMDALMTCPTFQMNAQKDEGKELVIVRGEPPNPKAISPHSPCCVIDSNEHLIVKFIKPKGNLQHPDGVCVRPGTTRNDLVVFHVEKDGKYLNTGLTEKLKLLSVCAYKGEPIEKALKRDGRFKTDVFSKLKDISKRNRTIKISNLVEDGLEDKTFKVIQGETSALKSQSNQPVPGTSTSTITSPSTTFPQQSATNVPLNTDMAEQTAKQNTRAKPRPIENSKEIYDLLCTQFNNLVKLMKDREGKSKSVKELLNVEYGKNTERVACMHVKMLRQLLVRADSVCQVRVEKKAKGTGFLLFDRFILTCAHVIENIYDHGSKQLNQEVTVSFCFEELGACSELPVKSQVVVFEKLTDHSGCYYDLALLELDLELDSPLAQNCPSGLLENVVVNSPQRGGICIIGHPDGGVKRTEACFIIPVGDREEVVNDRYKKLQPLITGLLFNEDHLTRLVNEHPVIAYDSCFSYGSSGSPVFDEFSNVVAMHTGGYVYKTKKGQPQKVHPQSFMEYAQPLSHILPRIIIQIVERRRFDVLEAYLHYTSIHKKDTHDQVKEAVRRIVETQNLSAFENELKAYNGDSEKIMEFIQFFSEPMDM